MKQLLTENKQTSKNPSKLRKLSPRFQQLPVKNEEDKLIYNSNKIIKYLELNPMK